MYRQRRPDGRDAVRRVARRSCAASTAASISRSWPRSFARARTATLMLDGVDARGSGHDLRRRRRDDRRRHDDRTRRRSCRARRRSARAAGFTPASRLTNATIGDDVTMLDHSVIVDSRVGRGARRSDRSRTCGPASDVGEDAHVGNFVELKKTHARPRLEGQPSGVSRRRDDRRATSTSAPARSPATTTASTSTRRSSRTACSSAATRSSSRR